MDKEKLNKCSKSYMEFSPFRCYVDILDDGKICAHMVRVTCKISIKSSVDRCRNGETYSGKLEVCSFM